MSEKAEEIRRVLSEPVVNLWKLRELALTEGGLVNDSLRKLAWPKLVGVNYCGYGQCVPSPALGQCVSQTAEITIPPSLDCEQINRDVSRVTWHLLTGNQRSRNFQMKNKHRKRILTLLKKKQRRLGDFVNLVLVQSYDNQIDIEREENISNCGVKYAMKEDYRLRYYQGYHDISSIVLSVLGGAVSVQTTLPLEKSFPSHHSSSISASNLTYSVDIHKAHVAAESMGLTLACQVLIKLSHSHFRDALKSNFQQLNAAIRLIVMPLTAAFDSEVHSHLIDCEMEPFFVLSWILTWFAHDVRDTSIVKRLFDFFISSHPLMSIYMSVAMMIHPLNRIEILSTDCDFACIHNALASLPKNSSNVGWKYMPGDGNYVSGDDDDDGSLTEGSLLDQSCDEPEDEGSLGSDSLLNCSKNARVPFQELIDLSISLMHKIPPRNVINLARRYHTEITLKPLMNEASSIALLQPPPNHCLASYTDSDWVIRQKLREEYGLKFNRHQRKNRFKLINGGVEYVVEDDLNSVKHQGERSSPLQKVKAVIASGLGPDGRAEEQKLRKRRSLFARSVAFGMLAVSVALVKCYFTDQFGKQPPPLFSSEKPSKSLFLKDVDMCYEHEGFHWESICYCVEYEEAYYVSFCSSESNISNLVEVEVGLSASAMQLSVVNDKEITRPSSIEHYLIHFVSEIVSTLHHLEPYFDILYNGVTKFIQFRNSELITSNILPSIEEAVSLEFEDGPLGWEDIAMHTWQRRGVMYQNQWKKIVRSTSDILRKGNNVRKEISRKGMSGAGGAAQS